jgi:aminoglycoside phosphotransferase (APT) family kinase protein
VLAYGLNGRHKTTNQPIQQNVIGKVFRDERGARLYALQKALVQSGFGPEAADGIQVPEALAYVPEMRMLVQAAVPGETLDTLTLRGNVGAEVRRCAAGLAKLHQSELRNAECGMRNGQSGLRLNSYTLADELRGLDDYTARLAAVRPDDLPVIETLRAGLLAWAERLPEAATAVPLHRDFYYSQVLFAGLRLHLIDFDLMALGDPAVDVANFIAHLAYLGLEQFNDLVRFDQEITDFLAVYQSAHATDTTFLERVAFYQAATFFRLLNVIAPRTAVCHLFPALLAHTQNQIGSILKIEPI